MSILVKSYTLGVVSTNCYVIYNDELNEAIVVDPADNGAYIKNKLEENKLNLKAVLLTHGHFDHILATEYLRNNYQVPVLAHKEEKEVLEHAFYNLSEAMGGDSFEVKADRYLSDGESLDLIGTKIKVIHTPGHTSGGACYYFEEEKLLFSGDTLFAGSVGRTDFPTGDMSTLIRSIKDKLSILGDDVIVYPGHEEETTIGRERKFNPYIS